MDARIRRHCSNLLQHVICERTRCGLAHVEQTAQSAATPQSPAPIQQAAAARTQGVETRRDRTGRTAFARSDQADETNAQAYHLLAITLEKLGHLHKALVTYERAFQLEPNDPDLVLNLGLTAWNTGNIERRGAHVPPLHRDAARSPRRLQQSRQRHARSRRHRRRRSKPLRGAIYRIPDQPMLWNTLATVLRKMAASRKASSSIRRR